MPEIFDNIDKSLFEALQKNLQDSERADFCVGYFNLRGWQKIDNYIEKWSGKNGECCRLLIGMQKLPQEELRDSLDALHFGDDDKVNGKAALYDLKRSMAKDFRDQLMLAYPTNDDGKGLRRLAGQLRSKKVVVKLFVRYLLHAKLYLLHGDKIPNSMIGYVGSSNLTFAGLSRQGELNIDVADDDTCKKLAIWFNGLWDDDLCIDISDDLLEVINESWAREEPIPPYHIYIKIAYHLAYEARAGLHDFKIPKELKEKLLEFQEAAVKIAARHLNQRGGVIIGDVVGLGKTLMATALARIFEDDQGLKTLIICPANLKDMWEEYASEYGLRGAEIMSKDVAEKRLPELKRYTLIIVDESHHFRNRDGKKYKALQNYIHRNDSKCILLSATPYNKSYIDLYNQLRLFIPQDKDIGIRPERLIRENGETLLTEREKIPISPLAAFEKSKHAEDWRDLMGLYLVRRTRSFISKHYAERDENSGRKYLKFSDGERYTFPKRIPNTVEFKVNEGDDNDPYARLFSDEMIGAINSLKLPRYGLGKYVDEYSQAPQTPEEKEIINNLSRAGRRLMGFCRTNLLKRMESSGHVFLLSLKHHILRNYVFLYALENQKPLPIGSMSINFNDSYTDEDINFDDVNYSRLRGRAQGCRDENDFMIEAKKIYGPSFELKKNGFSSISSMHFRDDLESDLRHDCKILLSCLNKLRDWRYEEDEKLKSLKDLIFNKHRKPKDKILIFSQFSDTINYLYSALKKEFRNRDLPIGNLDFITGDSKKRGKWKSPLQIARRFSPESNNIKNISDSEQIRVLLATDVLSEGQNLQDAHIVVNYDLPWAIIRLIQRAGRVDRLGQKSPNILCYSFLPANGIEAVIKLRERVHQRLKENSEVVGSDEYFFEDEDKKKVINLYNEQAGALDNDDDEDIDLSSHAYQIWKNAIKANPSLENKIERMPDFVFSSKSHIPEKHKPEGILVYVRSGQENNTLAWIDAEGNSVTESQFDILQAAACEPQTSALPHRNNHHELVTQGTRYIAEKEAKGFWGSPTETRFKVLKRLDEYLKDSEDYKEISQALQQMRNYALASDANDTLLRQLKFKVSDAELIKIVLNLYNDEKLCDSSQDKISGKRAKIICSMGLWE